MAAAEAGWADLPLDVLDGVIARLPFPGDRALFAAVCRPWRSAVHQLASNLPWIVLPYGSFCTVVSPDDDVDDTADGAAFFHQIPGLPENATCLGAAGDAWLALDCTGFALRRTRLRDLYCPDKKNYNDDPMPDVKHRHAYMLYNPFSSTTVPLPELDAIIGNNVAETLEVRKVLMRSSSSSDDVIAVTTNSCDYNVILCRPGKGTFVVPYCRVIDIAFLGRDVLYGITSGEELLAFHLGEDDDGTPNVSRFEVAIRNPSANYYTRDWWTWGHIMDDDDEEEEDQHSNSNGGEEDQAYDGDEQADQELDDDDDNNNQDEAANDDDDDSSNSGTDEDSNNEESDSDDDDDEVSDNEIRVGYDEEVPYEPKDEIYMGRYLVKSQSGELLLVRHQRQSSPYFDSYTRKVEVLKADLDMAKWDASSDGNGLNKGEALFLSRSFSKCARACGDIQDGFVYCVARLEDIFDMASQTTRDIMLWPWQCRQGHHRFLTWLFPPELVIN